MKISQAARQILPFYFIIFLFAVLLYGNSIKNRYALDDEMVTLNNERVEKGIRGIPAIFTRHHSIDSKSQYEYRPVVLLTFALEYQFFGRNPHVSHFINVLIYALTCVLIFYLLVFLFPSGNRQGFSSKNILPNTIEQTWGLYIFPLLITLLFTAHPLHSEVVNSLKSRDELLSFLFGLLSLSFILKYVDSGKHYLLLIGIFMLFIAMLSKRGAVIFIALIPLVLYFLKKISWQKTLIIGICAFAASAGFALFRRGMLSEDSIRVFYYFENPLFFEHGFLKRIPAGLYTLWGYVELQVFPHPLSFYYGYNHFPIVAWDNSKVWISLVFHSAIFFFAIKFFLKKHILSFAILFYLASIFPFSNIPTPAVGIIAERFTYIASLGFCIALAFFIMKLFKIPISSYSKVQTGHALSPSFPHAHSPSAHALPTSPHALSLSPKNPFFLGFSFIILSLYSFKIITRNPDWKDHLTLYRHDIKHLDNSAKAHALISNTIYPQLFNMPDGIQKDNHIKEAVLHYKKALEIYPDYITSNNNLGSIYFTFLGEYKTASYYFKKAVSLDSSYVEANYNLGYSYEKIEMKDSAIYYLEKTLALKPAYKPAFERLFSLLYYSGLYDKAIDLNLNAAKIFPQQKAVYLVNTANMYSAKQDTVIALEYFVKAFEAEPYNKDLCLHIAKVYEKINNKEKAKEYFNIAEGITRKE